MRPLLLLVDLQNDFLDSAGLEPAALEVVRGAARLLSGARAQGVPVIHAVTSVDPAEDTRMPHWKARGRWICLRGTTGHAPPPELAPLEGEAVVSKTFFSAFSAPALDQALADAGADTLWLAGVHLHGCVRATALDAYQRGFSVWVAEDAVGSDDPLHAALTRRYLEPRAARFAPSSEILRRRDALPAPVSASALPAAVVAGRARFAPEAPSEVHRSPRDAREVLFAVTAAGPAEVDAAVSAARAAQPGWESLGAGDRSAALARLADQLEAVAPTLARDLAVDVGKPLADGGGEIRRAVELLRGAAAGVSEPTRARCGPESAWRRVALGVVAAVTPWNNPVAIPIGKIAPALAWGNAVVWKPSPPATRIALTVLELARGAGLPDGLINLVTGGRATAEALMGSEGVDGVSLSGSSAAGWTAQEICARRRVALQAELGGNNAAIVWEGTDLARAADLLARGAFSFAGQRCTANRRVIVEARSLAPIVEALVAATGRLHWGDPLEPATDVGPLISREARARVAASIERAAADGDRILAPHVAEPAIAAPPERAGYLAPTLVISDRPQSPIVLEESFGPVLVVQAARDFDHALDLLNGPRQGLVAALFAGSERLRDQFFARARAGVLKWNQPTAGTDAAAPFGGWKSSGVGPPERGPGDAQFYTRIQALYGD
jgi:acyl-CoA reductase-like NAD-dependent aldehyde dehydrogenase/nicotinamidase-related amidase